MADNRGSAHYLPHLLHMFVATFFFLGLGHSLCFCAKNSAVVEGEWGGQACQKKVLKTACG